MWDAETLQQRYYMRHGQQLSGILFNSAGNRFLTWSSSQIRLWETETGRLLGALPAPGNADFDGVVWNGDHILNWFGGAIGLWDGVSSENIADVFVPNEFLGADYDSVRWTRARSHFLTWNEIYTDSPVVRVWTVEGEFDSISEVMSLQHEDERIDGAAWSPDEKMIVAWSQRMVKIWDAETADLLHVLNTDSYVTAARWSPNSRYLLVEDIREGAARIWDVRSGKEVLTIHNEAMWDTTGNRLLVGRQTILLVAVPTGETLAEFGPSLGLGYGLWNPDGVRLLVETAFGVQVWIVPPQDRCVVHALAPANLRAEPTTDSERVDILPRHRLAYVSGQTPGMDGFIWWQVGDNRWVRSDVVEETGRCFLPG